MKRILFFAVLLFVGGVKFGYCQNDSIWMMERTAIAFSDTGLVVDSIHYTGYGVQHVWCDAQFNDKFGHFMFGSNGTYLKDSSFQTMNNGNFFNWSQYTWQYI